MSIRAACINCGEYYRVPLTATYHCEACRCLPCDGTGKVFVFPGQSYPANKKTIKTCSICNGSGCDPKKVKTK